MLIPEFLTERANIALEHVTDVGAQQVARVYAEALLNVAEKSKAIDDVGAELTSLVDDVFAAQPTVAKLLQAGVVGRAVKERVLRKIGEERASPTFLNFLLVLNRHDRLELLQSVRDLYHELANARRRKIHVLVRSAVPLADDQLERLRNDLRAMAGLDPILDVKIVPELLGGVVIRIGDTLFDGSVRSKLLTLRSQLVEKSSHEIQSRRDRFCIAS